MSAKKKSLEVAVIDSRQAKPSLLTLLKTHGWHNGFDSPFANKETKILEQKLEIKQRNVILTRYDAEDITYHLNTLRKHYFQTNRDIDVTHALIRAKRQEVQSEAGFLSRVSDIETSMQRDSVVFRGKLDEMRERNQRLMLNITRKKPIVEELTKTIQSDSELTKIDEKKRESCILECMDISKLQSEDDKHVKDAETRIVEASRINKNLRAELDYRAMSTAKLHEQYTRSTREFRQMTKQRRDTIKMWEHSLHTMKSRDKEMWQLAEDYYEIRSLERELIMQIDEKNKIALEIKEANAERDRQIMLFDSEKSQLHIAISNARMRVSDLKTEKAQTNVTIQQISALIRDKQEFLAKTFDTVNSWTCKVQDLEKVVENIRYRYHNVKSLTFNHEDYIRELNKMNENIEAEIKALEWQINHIRTLKFNLEHEKAETKLETRMAETRISRMNGYIKRRIIKERRNVELYASLAGQMYKLDLEMGALEVRISHSMGNSENPNFLILQSTLTKRNDQLLQANQMEKGIQKEVDFLNLKIHQIKHEIEGLLKEKAYIDSTHNDVMKNLQMLTKVCKDCDEYFRNLRVDHSLKIVDKTRVMKIMKRHRNRLFKVAQHRETIASAVKERQAEVTHHLYLLDKLRKQMKSANVKIRVHINETLNQAGKLKSKYESLLLLMSPSSDTVVDERTFGFQVRKIARERESLIGEKIHWEERVAESLIELEGLKNVLETTKASNQMFRQSLQPADENSPECEALKQNKNNVKKAMVLRHRLQKAEELLKHKRKMLTYQTGILKQQVRVAKGEAEEKAVSLSSLQTEIARIKVKLTRYDKLINHTAVHSLAGKITSRTTKSIEKHIRIKAMGLKLRESLRKLIKFMDTGEDIQECIVNYLSTKNLYEELICKVRDQGQGTSKSKSDKLWTGKARPTY